MMDSQNTENIHISSQCQEEDYLETQMLYCLLEFLHEACKKKTNWNSTTSYKTCNNRTLSCNAETRFCPSHLSSSVRLDGQKNIDFFLRLLPLKVNELVMSEMKKKLGVIDFV